MNPTDSRACFVAHYLVTADAEASVMPRMLELFARRGLVPDRFEGVRQGDALLVELRSPDLDAPTAAHVGACMAGMVHVRAVRMLTASDLRPAVAA
jgi:hypothetical protein